MNWVQIIVAFLLGVFLSGTVMTFFGRAKSTVGG